MRLLLAEDERDLNAIITQKLTQEGYSVDCRFDGKSALDYLAMVEYAYEALAEDGTIIKKETDIVETLEAATSDEITLAEAKEIALADAEADEVTYTKAKLDKDDSIQVYEIEFTYGNYEYEFEINATSATIIEWEKEIDD